MTSPAIERLVGHLGKLPGLGPRSARRAALHLLERRESHLEPLLTALRTAAESVRPLRRLRQSRCPGPCASAPTRSATAPHLARRAGRGLVGAGTHADVPAAAITCWGASCRHLTGSVRGPRHRRPRRACRRARGQRNHPRHECHGGRADDGALSDRPARRERRRHLPPCPRPAGRRRARLSRRRHARHCAQGAPAASLSRRQGSTLDCGQGRPLWSRRAAGGAADPITGVNDGG